MRYLDGIRLLCIAIFISETAGENADFERFASEVLSFINETTTYVPRSNNDEFFGNGSNSDSALDHGTYDFIIVGSGSAGGVLVNRLTEVENFTVLLVEAGSEDPFASKVLGLYTYLMQSSYDWGYYTSAQKFAFLANTDRKSKYYRGKALGGSSTINGGGNTRGSTTDYDKWAELGNDGWSFEECLPYFKKMEKADFSVDIDDEFHGFDGPVHVNVPEDTPVLTEELLNAFIELGKTEGDYNGEDQFVVSRLQSLLDYNTRSGTAHSYLRPILNRTNLVVSLESLATKIIISGNAATGIEFWKNGTKYTASATKEVILSAGVINSPQLLMLSGIGPKEELDKHGIETIVDLPVGQYFSDQTAFQGMFYRTNSTFYNDTLLDYLDLWYHNKRPLIPGSATQVIAFYNVNGNTSEGSDIEILITGPPVNGPTYGEMIYKNNTVRVEILITNDSRSNYTFYNNTMLENLELWDNKKRPLTITESAQTITFYNVNGNTSEAADIEVLLLGPPNNGPTHGKMYTNASYTAVFDVLNTYTDFSLSLGLMQPKSVGEITLASADPRDFPSINPKYFSDSDDLETLYKAVEIVRNIENTTAFQRLGLEPIILDLPDCDADYEKRSKDWWICSFQYLSILGYHPVGATRMGNDTQNSVVSSKLKVHGIDNLRVVDAGVIPLPISGHTSTPTIMIGEKAADLIKNEYSCEKALIWKDDLFSRTVTVWNPR
ncbi:4-pyridoxate dehydrogenase-like [Dendroctonus ponderosae]|uniref:4-pyridoxate dehydrogenase-like n=1 Tax=Dendroctonus ponderosae TaxID=77166 RepID=UPI002034DDDD|nr:4-pyridoxate dehydrogenase-like [Dendroctonus ponderosae]